MKKLVTVLLIGLVFFSCGKDLRNTSWVSNDGTIFVIAENAAILQSGSVKFTGTYSNNTFEYTNSKGENHKVPIEIVNKNIIKMGTLVFSKIED